MNDTLYVILIDGTPNLYYKVRAIKTYLTRERAEREARILIEEDKRRGRKHVYQVGVFSTAELVEVAPIDRP